MRKFVVFLDLPDICWGSTPSKHTCIKAATIGPSAKRHLDGVSLMERWWPETRCWLGI